MTSVFTDFVRELDLETRQPSPELFDLLWQALRGLLAVEMKRRSVWQTRPSFLGVVGRGRWVESGTGSDGLDELTSDCFEYIFVRRLTSLRRHALEKANIDGLVLLGVRHFLLEAQIRNDPLGFHVFEVLRDSVDALVSEQRLHVLWGSTRIRNDTLLVLDPSVSPTGLRGVDLEPLIEIWLDRHLEALVTATHRRLSELRKTLGGELIGFLEPVAMGFRFGDLAAPLKIRVRRAWAARFLNLPSFLAESGTEGIGVEPEVEELGRREYLQTLVRCLEQFDALAPGDRDREDLAKLWDYLKALVFEEVSAGDLRADVPIPEGDKLPSQRKLAELLGIPRARLPGLFDRLRTRWSACIEELGTWEGPDTGGTIMEGEMASSPMHPSPQQRALAALRQSRSIGGGAESERVAVDALEFGDRFAFPLAAVEGVHWIVVAGPPATEVVRCAPADSYPWVGDRAVDLAREPDDPPEIVRPDYAVSLPAELPWLVRRFARADAAERSHLEERLETLKTDSPLAELPQELPAHREWLEEGPGCARGWVLRGLGAFDDGSSDAAPKSDESPAETTRPTGSPWWRLAAAAVLVASLGATAELARRNLELGRLVDGLSNPIVDLPYHEVQITPRIRSPWELEIPPQATHVEITVILVDPPAFPSYRLDLVRRSGELIFETEAFSPRREISLTFPAHRIEGEVLGLRLWGVEGEDAELVKEEQVRVSRAEP